MTGPCSRLRWLIFLLPSCSLLFTGLLALPAHAQAAGLAAAPVRSSSGGHRSPFGLVVRAERPDARRDAYIAQALGAWEAENFLSAEQRFRTLLAAYPELELAWIGLLASNLRLGQYQQVLQWAQRIPASLEFNPHLRILQAQALDVLRGPQAALTVLLSPDGDCSVRTARAAYLLRMQQTTDALALYLAVLRACPDRLDAALGFVMTAAFTQRFASAWNVYWQIHPWLQPQVQQETTNYLRWLQQRQQR